MSAAREYELDEQYGQCEWPRPPQGGWTADDLDRLPNLPPHTELIDGSLVFMSPQTAFHSRAMRLFEFALLDQASDALDVMREMTVKLDDINRLEPDVLVLRAGADAGPRDTFYRAEDVVLAIEVVSLDSKARDREVKPRKYAGAGCAAFWRAREGHRRAVAAFAALRERFAGRRGPSSGLRVALGRGVSGSVGLGRAVPGGPFGRRQRPAPRPRHGGHRVWLAHRCSWCGARSGRR
ncbi:hypothetical protein SANTM175S_07326 [Streptomyces antimycoticus]